MNVGGTLTDSARTKSRDLDPCGTGQRYVPVLGEDCSRNRGRSTYSANAPARFTPTPCVCAHKWRRPARQFRHRPHTTSLPRSPNRRDKDRHVRSTSTNLLRIRADNQRHVNGDSRQSFRVVDVQIGAQIAGAQNANFNVVDAGSGSGTSSSHRRERRGFSQGLSFLFPLAQRSIESEQSRHSFPNATFLIFSFF